MQEDANPECRECNGEGEVYGHFVNHKIKAVLFDWQYCRTCFPDSEGYWPGGEWEWIDGKQFDQLKEEGYMDQTGW